MSKTPRTDEHLRMKEENGYTVKVSSEFARQLERELAEARAEITHKNALIEQMHTALGRACHLCNVLNALIVNRPAQCQQCIVYAAISAAERGE
jgi:hypothetical protein